jgi:hypothetical protein
VTVERDINRETFSFVNKLNRLNETTNCTTVDSYSFSNTFSNLAAQFSVGEVVNKL